MFIELKKQKMEWKKEATTCECVDVAACILTICSLFLYRLLISLTLFLSLQAMLGSFLARAVIDEVLPPAFLSNRNNTHPGDEVVAKAVSLLSREHCSARLEKVWGPGDGRPVEELKESMDQLLKVCTILYFLVLWFYFAFLSLTYTM